LLALHVQRSFANSRLYNDNTCEQLIGLDNTAQRCPTYFAEFGFEVGHASCKYNYGGKPN